MFGTNHIDFIYGLAHPKLATGLPMINNNNILVFIVKHKNLEILAGINLVIEVITLDRMSNYFKVFILGAVGTDFNYKYVSLESENLVDY